MFRSRHHWQLALALFAAVSRSLVPVASAQMLIQRDKPAIDIWDYPFVMSATFGPAPVFASYGDSRFDNRDAQFYMSFSTTPVAASGNTPAQGGVAAGLGASRYLITAARITLTLSNSDTLFDGTYDPLSSFAADGGEINGDAGRPVELLGVGYRNGLTATTVTASTPFSTASGTPAPAGTRSVFATDFAGGTSLNGASRDVSNSVSGNLLHQQSPFDTQPFSIGQVNPAEDLDESGRIYGLSEMTFDLNLSNADLLRYLQLSLNAGVLNLMASSLFSTSREGAGFPVFYTDEAAGLAPRLSLTVQVVPEASAVTLLCCGCGLFIAFYRGLRGRTDEELP